MKDKQGREYLKEGDAIEGVMVEVDEHFECIPESERMQQVHVDDWKGPFLWCNHGRHYIEPNLEDGYYIGIYPYEQEE